MGTFANDPLLSQFYPRKCEFSFGQQVFLGVRSERTFTGAYKVFVILSSCKSGQVRSYSSVATSTSIFHYRLPFGSRPPILTQPHSGGSNIWLGNNTIKQPGMTLRLLTMSTRDNTGLKRHPVKCLAEYISS